jgi:DNA-binding NarL/FixJ family response regulator
MELKNMIKVLLVDDDALVLQGLQMRLALEPDVLVVGEAGDGVAALENIQTLAPDVVITDVNMPKMDGFTMIEQLREVAPHVAPIVLTVDDHEAARARARAAGAKAFICKQEEVEHLIEAIHRVTTPTTIDHQET